MTHLHRLPETPEPIEPLIRVSAVAEILGVTEKTVYRKVASGEIPVVRLGHRTLRFRPAQIRALIDSEALAA